MKSIAVIGAGPAGSLAALALAQALNKSANIEISLIGPVPTFIDSRTTALMVPAIEMLKQLGLWDALAPHSAPLQTMRIIDGTKRLIRAPTVSFSASEIDQDAFGYNIPNSALNTVLAEAIKTSHIKRIAQSVSSIDQAAPDHPSIILENGDRIETDLIIGADGKNSLCRDSAKITTRERDLPQSALVLAFEHSRPHNHVSTEFHTETGPVTQVPLPENRSSLVWVETPERAEELAQIEPQTLASLIEKRIAHILGPVTLSNDVRRQVYRLGTVLPSAFAKGHIALIGEAAHRFPPIGAQGLNLTTRDISHLVEALEKNRDLAKALSRYNTMRRADVSARFVAVNSLNHSLLSGFLPVQMLRAAGLSFLKQSSMARNFFMREGMAPGSTFSKISKPKWPFSRRHGDPKETDQAV